MIDGKHPGKRILAIDYGEKRIGIAITDPLLLFAYPLTTLENNNKFWGNFSQIMKDYDIAKILLGYPLKETGEKTHATEHVEKFAKTLENNTKIKAELVDERYSSSIAKKNILESTPKKKKRRDKKLVDMNAASVILKNYLDEHENEKIFL